MNCKICEKLSKEFFSAKVLNKFDVGYFLCGNCGFLQTEEPYWLKEAYNSPINLSDTGLVQRNIYLSRKITLLLYFIFGQNEKYLDFAGGYGLFTRIMRDIGFDFHHHDPFTENLFARGFEIQNNEKYAAVTSFETFEHFVNPLEEIEKMLEYSQSIIFTTELLPNKLPAPTEWWYYGLEHGQHVSFYSIHTLKFISNKYGLNLYTNGRIHLFTNKKFNQKFFTLLLKSSKFSLFKIVCKKMKSRTLSDMNLLITVKEKNLI